MPRNIHKRTEEVFDANNVHSLHFLLVGFLFILLNSPSFIRSKNRELACYEAFHLLSGEIQAHHKVLTLFYIPCPHFNTAKSYLYCFIF